MHAVQSSRESGRKKFSAYKPIIIALCSVYRLMPAFLQNAFYSLFGGFAGRIGTVVRYIHFKSVMAGLGDSAYMANMCVVKGAQNVQVGENFSLHEFCYLDGAGGITIGNNVAIAHNCSLVSFEHTWVDEAVPIKYNPTSLKKIVIEDDVWLGCGVRVLGGSHIKSRVVVAAGSVVKGELESGYLYAGVPARKIKSL